MSCFVQVCHWMVQCVKILKKIQSGSCNVITGRKKTNKQTNDNTEVDGPYILPQGGQGRQQGGKWCVMWWIKM